MNYLDKRQYSILVLIVLIGFGVRLFFATNIIPSLNWDEVSHGFNAYSILHTAKDEWGNLLPTIFRAYGDYKLPVYIYLSIPFISIFDLSELSVRLLSILAGTGSIIFSYFLAKVVTKNNKTALLASLLMAIEPWSLFASSFAAEANLAVFFIVAGSYFLLSSTKSPRRILPALILLGLAVWTYNSARIFVPLLLIAYFLIEQRSILNLVKKNHKLSFITIILSSVLFLGMIFQLLGTSGQARYSWVRIIDEGAIGEINSNRNTSQLPPMINRFVYNKLTYFTRTFTISYLSHFSPRFLFVSGGTHYQFSLQGHGLLYLLDAIFIPIGIILSLIKSKKDKKYLFIILWLLLAPIPSALTKDTPHALRSIILLPIPQFLSAVGITFLLEKSQKSSIQIGFVSIFIISLFISAENYIDKGINEYKSKYSWSWQYGYKQLVLRLRNNYYSKYDSIQITKKYGEPHEFLLFYWPWDPEKYNKDPQLRRYFQTNWYWVDSFDKFRFINDWEIVSKTICYPNQRCLLATSFNNHPEGWSKIDDIKFLDNSPAFEIYEKDNRK